MFERLSEWISATSFAIRRVRLDDMAENDVKVDFWKMSLWKESRPFMRKDDSRLHKVIVAIGPKPALCRDTCRSYLCDDIFSLLR